jgi:hypothetical protein
MPSKKETGGTVRYVVLRDFGGNLAGDVIDLDPTNATDLIRDGMVAPAEEG